MLERVDAALAVFSEEVRRGPAGSAPPGIAPSNAYLRKELRVHCWQQGRPKAPGRCIDIHFSRQPLKDDFDEH